MIKIQAIGRISALAAAAALTVTAIAPVSAAVADPAPAAAKAKKPTRYCVENTTVGSNIVRKTCKTRDEWIQAEGFDPIRRR